MSLQSLPILNLLQRTLRISVSDERIFIGTFLGTDQPLNVVLANTEEFRLGSHENPTGRYVGQVMIPWKLVVKAEAEETHHSLPTGPVTAVAAGIL